MKGRPAAARFAERVLRGVDDAGAEERIVIWIERKPGAVWAVGRIVNPQHRSSDQPRRDDYVFEGYELEDALDAANATLRDDARVSAQDGRIEPVDQGVLDWLEVHELHEVVSGAVPGRQSPDDIVLFKSNGMAALDLAAGALALERARERGVGRML